MNTYTVKFKQLMEHNGLLVGLDEWGQVWVCNNEKAGGWTKISAPTVELASTPAPSSKRRGSTGKWL